jgi:hypothetical protein
MNEKSERIKAIESIYLAASEYPCGPPSWLDDCLIKLGVTHEELDQAEKPEGSG